VAEYYYGRNDALDARDFFNSGPFFDAGGRAVTPPFKQHLYGGTLGGPLQRDRHFFFGSFEGFRQKLEQTRRRRRFPTRRSSARSPRIFGYDPTSRSSAS
jgi:hypothetical protein